MDSPAPPEGCTPVKTLVAGDSSPLGERPDERPAGAPGVQVVAQASGVPATLSAGRTTRMKMEVGPRPAEASAGGAAVPYAGDLTCVASRCSPSGETGNPEVSILLVDDRPVNLVILDAMLAGPGRNLVKANSGPEALQCCLEQDFAVILLDVQMPGMDGFETATFIRQRERSRDTPIIFVTAIDNVSDSARKGYSLGAVDFIFKPIVPAALNAKVSVFIALFLRTEEVKRQVELLRQSQERYTNIVENSTDGIIVLGPEEIILYANPAAANLFGQPRESLMGTRLGMPMSAGEMTELDIVRPGGEQRTAELHVGRTDWNGRPTILITLHDITERKRAQERIESQQEDLLQARKLESIGRLAAGIAHEINTPTQFVSDNVTFLADALKDLDGIVTRAQRLADANGSTTPESSTLREAIQKADLPYLQQEVPKALTQTREGLDLIARIVRAMKDFSHPGSTEKTPTDLNHAIETTVTVARNEWKYVAEVKLELDPRLPPVPCLPGELNQVLLNLLVNAAHAIEGVVGGNTEHKGLITIRSRQDKDCAEIGIADTGTGMSDTVRQRLFEPFFTTKPQGKGTGQGLALAWNVVVKKHGGTLDVRTEEGKGTEFVLRLPLLTDADASKAVKGY